MEIYHGIIENFSPKNKSFSFNFTKDTCYKVANGICALDAFKDQLSLDYKDNIEQGANRCIIVYQLLIYNNIPSWSTPQLIKYRCGHYTFDDGQHRICIAGRLNLTLSVELYENTDDVCGKCAGLGEFIVTF